MQHVSGKSKVHHEIVEKVKPEVKAVAKLKCAMVGNCVISFFFVSMSQCDGGCQLLISSCSRLSVGQ